MCRISVLLRIFEMLVLIFGVLCTRSVSIFAFCARKVHLFVVWFGDLRVMMRTGVLCLVVLYSAAMDDNLLPDLNPDDNLFNRCYQSMESGEQSKYQ